MSDERREIRAKVRSYEKDGETKNIYATIGTAWVSEHGNKIKLQLETIPVAGWDGVAFINKPYEKKEDSADYTKQDVIADVPDGEINLNDIPF